MGGINIYENAGTCTQEQIPRVSGKLSQPGETTGMLNRNNVKVLLLSQKGTPKTVAAAFTE